MYEDPTHSYLWIFLVLVGYGTQTPSSITGKAIGGFCAIIGVFILTFSVRIVVEGFARHYRLVNLKTKEKLLGYITNKTVRRWVFSSQ